MGRVAGDAGARTAGVVAPDLVRAVGGEEVAAARGVAEAHRVRAAFADELDRGGGDAGEQLVDGARPSRRQGAELAGAAAELADERHGTRPRVEAPGRAGRERDAVDRCLQD